MRIRAAFRYFWPNRRPTDIAAAGEFVERRACARRLMVTVTRIDRLARSTFDLFGIVKRIVDAKNSVPSRNRGPFTDAMSCLYRAH